MIGSLLKKSFFSATHSSQKSQEQHPQKLNLYDAHNIEHCVWPESEEGRYAQQFLTPLIQNGVSTYIENVRTDFRVLVHDQLVLPITINETEYDNSYVCSPYSYYISYGKESLSLLTRPGVYHAIQTLLWGSAKILRQCKVNKVVMVNNWLSSTSLYPTLQPQQLADILQFLQQQFPEHAIVFRSVDSHTNPVCYEALRPLGFDYLASRQIFFINPKQSTLFESRLFKTDLKLLQNSGYEIIDSDQLTEKDFSRLLALYEGLYIQKYSNLNPKFSKDFLHLMITKKLMHFKALKKDGRIDGVVGYMQRHGMMFCPFFGYDRTLPKEIALYRLLSTVLMLEAHERNLLFHLSSGASTFKKIRKAQDCIEYIAVYHRHLKLRRQIPWILLKKMANSFGIKYMTRY